MTRKADRASERHAVLVAGTAAADDENAQGSLFL
jgi:hypothetical protein